MFPRCQRLFCYILLDDIFSLISVFNSSMIVIFTYFPINGPGLPVVWALIIIFRSLAFVIICKSPQRKYRENTWMVTFSKYARFIRHVHRIPIQLAFSCSKSSTETLENGFRISSKLTTKTTSMTSFWCFYC